jgi:type I restriction enzyme S subunit
MDWPMVRLDSLYNIARGGSPRPIKDFITDDPNGINWIKIGDATASGKYIYTTKQKIKPEGIQRSRLVKEGDFILSNSMSFGRPYIMATSGCIHDGWLVLSAKDDQVDQDFLYHLLGSPFVFSQFDSLAAGSTVRNLNIDLVSGVKIPLLPIPEQQRIVTLLDEAFADIEKARTNAKQNLKNARELFDSYLQQVFSQRGEGWEKKAWGDLCSFVRGPFGGSLKKSMFKESGYTVFEQKHAIHDHIEQFRYFIDEDKFLEMKRFEVKPGEMIMSCSGVTLGRVSVIPNAAPQGIINQALLKLTPKDGTDIHFIKYWIRSPIFQEIIFKDAGGAAQPNVPAAKKLKEITLSIPNIKHQHAVVKEIELCLETNRKLIKVYETKLRSLDELKKSLLQKAFSGELTKSKGMAA